MAMIAVTVLCFMLVIVFQAVKTHYQYGLSAIPGPFLARVSNLWKIIAVYRKNMPRRNIALHEKYGSVVRIGPQHVSCASPEALQIIHASRSAFPKVENLP